MDLNSFIQAIPKTETHLHIEGALPYELLVEMDASRFPARPSFREPGYRYPSFPDFEKTLLDNAAQWYTSAERYHVAAKRLFSRMAALNVRYIETSFHLPMVGFIGVPGPEIIDAILSAAPAGVIVRVFAGMLRNSYADGLRPVIDELHAWKQLAGIDLHGFEQMPTESWTRPVWERVRAAGKVTKCHAGEFDGAARVREAIEQLGVRRVQHGVRAIEDPAVVRLAVEAGAVFDVCPISNVRLKVVPSMREHPLARLMKAGVRCTVSTDDPLCFANTVSDEYHALATEAGLSRSELLQIARTGWEVALIDEHTRQQALQELDALANTATA
jgi:adenosine deaminase